MIDAENRVRVVNIVLGFALRMGRVQDGEYCTACNVPEVCGTENTNMCTENQKQMKRTRGAASSWSSFSVSWKSSRSLS